MAPPWGCSRVVGSGAVLYLDGRGLGRRCGFSRFLMLKCLAWAHGLDPKRPKPLVCKAKASCDVRRSTICDQHAALWHARVDTHARAQGGRLTGGSASRRPNEPIRDAAIRAGGPRAWHQPAIGPSGLAPCEEEAHAALDAAFPPWLRAVREVAAAGRVDAACEALQPRYAVDGSLPRADPLRR